MNQKMLLGECCYIEFENVEKQNMILIKDIEPGLVAQLRVVLVMN